MHWNKSNTKLNVEFIKNNTIVFFLDSLCFQPTKLMTLCKLQEFNILGLHDGLIIVYRGKIRTQFDPLFTLTS